jgi:UDP-glucose 4-epimerase
VKWTGRGEAFNIGSPHETSVLELAQTVKRLTRSKSPIQFVPYEVYFGPGFEDPRRRVPAIDNAKRLLGFQPKVGLETGLKKTLAWCRDHYRH